MAEQAKCKELIASQMASREEYVKNLQVFAGNYADSEVSEPAQEELDNLPLSIETKQITTITLSYGGPADYLDVIHDGAEVISVSYRYEDWYDSATLVLRDTSPLWDYAVSMIDCIQS